ncbi:MULTISPECIES: ABC transporter substrate-binding protein [unclassified Frondihabitans]|uniref:ABC transporter substrate-binding protein n=1 Tax=unclassified Frondihabitans TaxID=2626248 RepID=UPI0006F4E751|nr:MULTISPECIES: sugar ABC transporter substrate-binding protein [unclassified Frondihabitans]KQQ28484.1 sugar ABC transporter substrate-binding protein [Frondihabitans sp. Leaf304]RPE78515.1 multiple sugar transport system substrate-binding protein [Frondihabitans sp. PhB153]RPF08796.1 multiple sugar transport system substrate-binding protein [Frondihabitans sp. PhB161]
MKKSKFLSAAAVAVAATIALAGCSAGSGAGDSGSDTAASCKASTGKVTLNFTSWVPNMDKVVALWNKENPDIQVKVSIVANGNSGTYKNFFNQLKAGNAPDIGQVEYDTLPAFRVQDGLANIASCSGVSDAKADFSDGLWNQVTFGEANSVYAIPQDSGPMALYYRKDLFDKAGLSVPTTWAEYAADAVKIKALGGNITNFAKGDVNQFAGLVSQAGGQWFSTDDGTWDVNLTSAESTKVADYWQDLISKKLVNTLPSFTDEWNNAYNTGQDWTWVSAVWGANTISSGAPKTSGKWAVAQMPQWTEGDKASAAWGGSSSVVFKGSKHPAEASKFLVWLNTSKEALTALNKEANLYPASSTGADLPALTSGVEFYGNQAIYKDFATAAENIQPFTWGPTMTQTYSDVSDGFGSAISGSGTLSDALSSGQTKTIAALKAQSIAVK